MKKNINIKTLTFETEKTTSVNVQERLPIVVSLRSEGELHINPYQPYFFIESPV